ncbi:MAG: RNA polymerase sigma factor [Verrucomicrobia bacterium]|nr:RNA polymerase sigma factor [Verrucomicrobiota bacterium]
MTDTNQFEAFMKAYQNMVFSTAVRLLGNPVEAEDVSQEVFLKAYERFADLSQSPTVGGWLKTVTTNLCLNHLTRYRARWRFFSEMFQSEENDEVAPEIPAPDTFNQELEGSDYRQLLEGALQKLPNSQRVPLVLYHFENLRYEEIAAKLGISLSKVKTDIFRGREALRRKLRLKSTGGDEWSDFEPKPAGELPGQDRTRTRPLRQTRSVLALGLSCP